MPVDYSKWDSLEISDDSDIEVHPNVDKKSFIRAKQAQIHAARQDRKVGIKKLKYEHIINNELIKRITALLNSLKLHAADAKTGNLEEIAFKAVFESASTNPEDDMPPPRPDGLYVGDDDPPLPSYTKMMGSLLDQVNTLLNSTKPVDRYAAMVDDVGAHLARVEDLQVKLLAKLAELEMEDANKITSDNMHTGFDISHVNKPKPSASTAKADEAKTGKTMELLNPSYQAPAENKTTADKVDDDDDRVPPASVISQEFSTLDPTNYSALLDFLSSHPEILASSETDSLLIMAFEAEMKKNHAQARNCVHQALLLQYCRALGKDGVALFFRRINSPGHQAQTVFHNDINETYSKIASRAAEMLVESAAEGGNGEGTAQIQLQPMEPGTVLNISIPPADSSDPEVQQAWAIFSTLSPQMKKALESGELTEVNKALGELEVDEAEEVVRKFGEAGILSLEDEIMDTTTEEGKEHFKEWEAKNMGAAGEGEEAAVAVEHIDEATKTAAKYSSDPE